MSVETIILKNVSANGQSNVLRRSGHRFIGYANLQKVRPAFVLPVFSYDALPVVQQVDESEHISGFLPYDKESFGEIIPIKRNLYLEKGDLAVHGFIGESGCLMLSHKEELKSKLREALTNSQNAFGNRHFFLLEILHYLDDEEGIARQLNVIKNVFADDPSISKNFVELELSRLNQKKTIELPKDPLIKEVKSGFINFWDLHTNLPNVFQQYGRAYMQFQLARSFAGLNPKVINLLAGIGVNSPKINRRTSFVPFNYRLWVRTRDTIIKYLIITDIRYFTEYNVLASIQVIDPSKIVRKYLKKDQRKIVKGNSSQDYSYNSLNVHDYRKISEVAVP